MSLRALRASLALYAGLLVAPLGTSVGPTIPSFLAAGLVGAAVAIGLTARIDVADRFEGWWFVVAAVLPGSWLVSVIAAPPPAGTVPWARLLGALAVAPGIVAVVLADQIQRQRRPDPAAHVTFTARLPTRERRQMTVAMVVLLGLTGAIAGWTLLGEAEPTDFVWVPSLVPVWIAILQTDRSRDVQVTDHGLEVETQRHPWETIAGYRLEDGTLSIERTDWYRSTLSFDAADIEDLDAVVDTLDRCLAER